MLASIHTPPYKYNRDKRITSDLVVGVSVS
jgi:hypothetical protein